MREGRGHNREERSDRSCAHVSRLEHNHDGAGESKGREDEAPDAFREGSRPQEEALPDWNIRRTGGAARHHREAVRLGNLHEPHVREPVRLDERGRPEAVEALIEDDLRLADFVAGRPGRRVQTDHEELDFELAHFGNLVQRPHVDAREGGGWDADSRVVERRSEDLPDSVRCVWEQRAEAVAEAIGSVVPWEDRSD